MSRIWSISLVCCAMLASSVLAYWEYDGTTVSVGGPGSASDPQGTWEWLATGSGNVDYDVDYIDASGQVWGDASVKLYTTYQLGLQRMAYAHSDVKATSTYRWVDDDASKEITAVVLLTIDESDIEYYGSAVDYLGTSRVTCSSTAYVQGGGDVTSLVSYYPYGLGQGEADTQGGSWADNDWYGVEATYDYTDYSTDSNIPALGWYEGELHISGSVQFSYTGTPAGELFYAAAGLNGFTHVEGEIDLNDPDFHYGGFEADGSYYVRGRSRLDLYGDVADRE